MSQVSCFPIGTSIETKPHPIGCRPRSLIFALVRGFDGGVTSPTEEGAARFVEGATGSGQDGQQHDNMGLLSALPAFQPAFWRRLG